MSISVCHVVSTFPPVVGGVQRATADLCTALSSEGAKVAVVTRAQGGAPRTESIQGVTVVRTGLEFSGKIGAATFALHSIFLLLTRFRGYRIVHVQNIDAPLLIGLVVRKLSRRCLVATIHGEAKVRAKNRTARGRLRLAVMRRTVDRFGAITSAMREVLLEVGVPVDRVHVIPNGIDLEIYRRPTPSERREHRARLEVPDQALLVVAIGRLVNLKRIDVLLRAWKRLEMAGALLTVVGDGPQRDELEGLSAELGCDNVRFTGFSAAPRDYLWAADIFVQSSEEEGLPVALLEAMGTGLPSVVSDIAGHLEVVVHQSTGLTFVEGDPDSLHAQMVDLAASPTKREFLGDAAARAVRSDYSIKSVAAAHLSLYDDCL